MFHDVRYLSSRPVLYVLLQADLTDALSSLTTGIRLVEEEARQLLEELTQRESGAIEGPTGLARTLKEFMAQAGEQEKELQESVMECR